jgi:hypothetical protein
MERYTEMCIDLETVSDMTIEQIGAMRETIKPPTGWKDPAKIEARKSEKLLKMVDEAALNPQTGKIIVAGMAVLDRDDWDVGILMDKEEDEASFLRIVDKAIYDAAPIKIITFNGKDFDIPYLGARYMKNNVCPGFKLPLRYDNRHFDLFDLLGRKGSLDSWLRALRGKGTWGEGSKVSEWHANKDWESIVKHCKSDIEGLIFLWEMFKKTFQL